MSVLCDKEIKTLCVEKEMITPFVDRPVKEDGGNKVISYGLSSYGYDIRISDEFSSYKHQTRHDAQIIDPKNTSGKFSEMHKSNIYILSPGEFVLGMSFEKFKVPRDLLITCTGKSTYARVGIIVNVTPLEPEWEGHLTMMIGNVGSLPVAIYSLEGIAQLIFHKASEVCETSYADKGGKYQGSEGITHAKV